jgi:hypothetical protein
VAHIQVIQPVLQLPALVLLLVLALAHLRHLVLHLLDLLLEATDSCLAVSCRLVGRGRCRMLVRGLSMIDAVQ